MRLSQYLARLGYAPRRDCERWIAARRVTDGAGRPLADRSPFTHDDVRVDGAPLDPPPGVVVLLHKPAGYVCSLQDRPPLVYDLLPSRFRQRDPVLAPVGRLDADTTGALLLTDDGALNHRLTSPRHHVAKVYLATVAEPLRGDEGAAFAAGTLVLNGEPAPCAPAPLEAVDAHRARVTLHEGRYHQVRRMFAALGHHVTALHREAVGPIALDGLAEGAWRVLSAADRSRLADAPRRAP
ncbi:MAG: 16S rRNA pseudouridine(516) synthase [Gemmatimonadetes bacterium]|nr:16S rRNA pseudouridine(516) synthase [Gemmatimonadota bacterium]